MHALLDVVSGFAAPPYLYIHLSCPLHPMARCAVRHVSDVEKEEWLPDYDKHGVFEDYNEIVLQFGFVTLFAANFPFIGVLAFANNLLEIRSDGFKLVNVMRRPGPAPAENIGTWYGVMELMSFAAVTTNCATIFLVSHLSESWDWEWRILGLFVAEHAAFGLKLFYAIQVDDIEPQVQKKIDEEEAVRRKHHVKQLLDKMDREFHQDLKEYRRCDDEILPGPDNVRNWNEFKPFPGATKIKSRRPAAEPVLLSIEVDASNAAPTESSVRAEEKEQDASAAGYSFGPSVSSGQPVPTASV